MSESDENDAAEDKADDNTDDQPPTQDTPEPMPPGSEGYAFLNPPVGWSQPVGADSNRPMVTRIEPPQRGRPASRASRSSNFWPLMGCNLIVFVTSVCIMVLELTASRLIAKHVGSSLYTWTSVIGIVLAGITIGNYIGGWLADRFSHRKTLAWLFLNASILCFSVLWMDQIVNDVPRPDNIEWPTWVLCIVAAVYLLPSMAMGTISPVVASLALSRSTHTGITVGNVYAWGTFGSIVGTFLTGFFLIDAFGTKAIVGMTAATLAIMGIIMATGQRTLRAAVCFGWLQFIFILGLAASANSTSLQHVGRVVDSLLAPKAQAATTTDEDAANGPSIDDEAPNSPETRKSWSTFGDRLGRNLHDLGLTLRLRDDPMGQYHDESNYYYINIYESPKSLGSNSEDRVKVLRLDKLIHSYYNPRKPTSLYYDYERIYAAVTERAIASRSQTISRPIADFPGRDTLIPRLPDWCNYNPATESLQVKSAFSGEHLRMLDQLAPTGDFWQAVEELQRLTSAPGWGGFSSVQLKELPNGVVIPDELRETLMYDKTLQMLNAYQEMSPEIVTQLTQLTPDAPFHAAVRRLYAQARRVSTLFIGGGGFVFPRWVEAEFPYEPRIDVAEVDPGVKLAVRRALGLPPDDQTAIKTHIGDARNFVDDRLRANTAARDQGRPPVLYDFVYGDAFNDFSVPWHLTTREFSQKIADLLSDDGVYLVNIIDAYPRVVAPTTDASGGLSDPDSGTLPESLLPKNVDLETWNPCPAPFHGLDVIRLGSDGGYLLAFHGCMPDALRERLMQVAADNAALRSAVKDLYARSRRLRTGRFLGRYVKTTADVLPNVYIFSSHLDGRPTGNRDTFIVVASRSPIDMQDLEQAGDYWSAEPFAWLERDAETGATVFGGQMENVLLLAEGHMLTDDFAPVDNLLSPVFVDRGN